MKRISVHKFYLKHTQNGFVLLFTLLLLLIIATLTIAFFYLMFLEVHLISHETEYLQAFYLAEAGLEQGEKELKQNPKIINYIKKHIELTCEQLGNLTNQNNYSYKNSLLNSTDIQGNFCYGYKLDSNIPVDSNIPLVEGNITITGKGWVYEDSQNTSEIMNERIENRREIEKRFGWHAFGIRGSEDWHDPDFGKMANLLDNPVVTSTEKPNLQEKITFIEYDIVAKNKKISENQEKILTPDKMTKDQREYYFNVFPSICRNKISYARIFDPDNPRNQNRSIFDPNNFDPIRKSFIFTYYYGLRNYIIDSSYGKGFKEFYYKETRPSDEEKPLKPGETTIRPFMTLKSNQELTLKEGLYFFEELILEENSILNTDGAVSIYVKKLELKEKAKLMGGTTINPDDASPNDLIILSKCWPGSGCDIEDDWIKIGSTAKICGHIFAPDLKVILCKGSMGKNTRVYGSILTYQLVTANCNPTDRSYGPIWIIYQEYSEEHLEEIPGSWKEVRNP